MKSYLLAARPKTLPAAVVPVWVGCMLAYHLTGQWDVLLSVYTFMGAIWIQIATNFFNDAIDAKKGADTKARLGPARVTASGKLSGRAVYLSAVVCLLIASVFGALLILERGWPILAIGLPSLYLCYGYTGGAVPLAYRGLGELFVILFFGVVAVSGTFFVQTGGWSVMTTLTGVAIGCLSAVLILINNLRDADEDRKSQKNTLAVKWGRRKALVLLQVITLFPYGIIGYLFGYRIELMYFLPAAILVGLIHKLVSQTPPSALYNRFLAISAIQLLLYAAAIQLIVLS